MSDSTLLDGFDATDPSVYEKRMPHPEFAHLRTTAPVWWNPQPPHLGGFPDEGFWVVTKHRDVRDVSRRSNVFSSGRNGAIPRLEDGITSEQRELTKQVLISRDAPEHTRLRGLVSKLFTPRAVDALRHALEERAERIVGAAVDRGHGEFVREVAAELPMQAIADLLGVPARDRRKLFDWSNEMMGYDDPDFETKAQMALAQILGYSYEIAEDRRSSPTGDIISRLVNADIEGEALTPEQFGFFVVMLTVAGNETTRNATTMAMIAFLDNPEQWKLFKERRPATTADEVVRYTTPLICQQRTARIDTEINGTAIAEGDRVVLMYASANFDEEVFENPMQFDITRNPNPHLGFGGTGAHYCIGANLARMELSIVLGKIADRMPDISSLGEAERFRSGWINGIKRWPADYLGMGAPTSSNSAADRRPERHHQDGHNGND
jgi:cholest-4-en-3-one 26-monooxygenase